MTACGCLRILPNLDDGVGLHLGSFETVCE